MWWVGGAFFTLAWAVVMGKKTSLDSLTVGEGVVCRKNMGYESLGTVASFLRLFVCSKYELSLARAVMISKLLANQQFTLVRGEAEELVKMSMFQSIVSVVRIVGLGGKANQPEEENSTYNSLPFDKV